MPSFSLKLRNLEGSPVPGKIEGPCFGPWRKTREIALKVERHHRTRGIIRIVHSFSLPLLEVITVQCRTVLLPYGALDPSLPVSRCARQLVTTAVVRYGGRHQSLYLVLS
jgi:hypothetical protein